MSEVASQDDVVWFCRQVRARSNEHREVMSVAAQRGWLSTAVGTLRQELDSMVRVIFLLEQVDTGLRRQLLHQAVAGEIWTLPTSNGRPRRVTDRDMVDLAQRIHEGWTERVYRFGCRFIHLSNMHDYHARDPFRGLPWEEREDIAQYLRYYHDGDVSAESTFEEVAAYAPRVLDKIASNLEHSLRDLERRAG